MLVALPQDSLLVDMKEDVRMPKHNNRRSPGNVAPEIRPKTFDSMTNYSGLSLFRVFFAISLLWLVIHKY